MTEKFVQPLSDIEDCIDTLAGNEFFSLLDFGSGFHQLPLEEKSQVLTAFKTEDGLFQYKRMPFGLANAPSFFQKMVSATLAGLREINLQISIHDICVSCPTWEQQMQVPEKVFEVVI